ncbi:MAG: DUF2177 family protein [Gemmatimonadales bacterium]|jgi:uncharacterized membrane protein
MTLPVFLKLYAVALPTFLAIDLLWLGVIARAFYRAQLSHLMRADVNWIAAGAFYVVFVVGIVILSIGPAIERRSARRAMLLGALLGLVTYAAFDLTSLAVLEGFPLGMAVVDMMWGAVLCGAVSGITYRVWVRLT